MHKFVLAIAFAVMPLFAQAQSADTTFNQPQSGTDSGESSVGVVPQGVATLPNLDTVMPGLPGAAQPLAGEPTLDSPARPSTKSQDGK
jgi:hypothetical protein